MFHLIKEERNIRINSREAKERIKARSHSTKSIEQRHKEKVLIQGFP